MGFAVGVGAAEADVSQHAVVEGHQGAALAADSESFGDAAEEANGGGGVSGGGGGVGGEGAHGHLVLDGGLIGFYFRAGRLCDGPAILMTAVIADPLA